MHRHGTLRGRWKALAFGALWFVVGALLVRHFGAGLFAGAVPRAPSGGELVGILFGAGFITIGAILGLTPHVLWLLRTFYKEDFARHTPCPVTLVCMSCGEYNTLAGRGCRTCGESLAGAPRAGTAAAERFRYGHDELGPGENADRPDVPSDA